MTLLWEDGFDAWSHFDVSSQPTLVMATAEGTPIERWRGQPSVEDLLDALQRAA